MRGVLWLGALAMGWTLPAGAQGRTDLVIVSGVSGQPQQKLAFQAQAAALMQAARSRFALPDSQVWYLGEDSATGQGRASKVAVERTLGTLVAGGGAGDRLVVILLGHGNAQGDVTRFNLPGPDMTVDDFARVLVPYRGTLAFIHTGSASGEFVQALSGARRIVITATKSAREQNETFFPAHFVRALTSATGDADKDGRVSLLEAFTYARKEVERFFEQENRLPSEHPQLDDDGDKTGHADARPQGPEGRLAATFFLEPVGGAVLAADPRAAPLLAERRALEARIDSLRARRSTLSEEAYQNALEPLVLKLAEANRALRALGGRQP